MHQKLDTTAQPPAPTQTQQTLRERFTGHAEPYGSSYAGKLPPTVNTFVEKGANLPGLTAQEAWQVEKIGTLAALHAMKQGFDGHAGQAWEKPGGQEELTKQWVALGRDVEVWKASPPPVTITLERSGRQATARPTEARDTIFGSRPAAADIRLEFQGDVTSDPTSSQPGRGTANAFSVWRDPSAEAANANTALSVSERIGKDIHAAGVEIQAYSGRIADALASPDPAVANEAECVWDVLQGAMAEMRGFLGNDAHAATNVGQQRNIA
jgi:hypothetical protein